MLRLLHHALVDALDDQVAVNSPRGFQKVTIVLGDTPLTERGMQSLPILRDQFATILLIIGCVLSTSSVDMAYPGSAPGGNAIAAVPTPLTANVFFTPEDFASPMVTVFVGPEATPIKAHESILTKCEYFAKCLQSGHFPEGVKNEINMRDDDPDTFVKIIQFLYTGKLYYGNDKDIKLLARKHSCTSASISELISVHAMADKYCIEEICTHVEALLDTGFSAEHLAWRHFQQIEAAGLRGSPLWEKLKKKVVSELVQPSFAVNLKAMLDDGLAFDSEMAIDLLHGLAMGKGVTTAPAAPAGPVWTWTGTTLIHQHRYQSLQ